MDKKEHGELLVKVVTRSGQVLGLYSNESTLEEMLAHPKFLKLHDTKNYIFLSIEDIAAFEILNYRESDVAPAPSEAPVTDAPAEANGDQVQTQCQTC